MRRFLPTILCLGILALTNVPASALERFPPPEFDTDYQMPNITTPEPKQHPYEVLAPTVLLITLTLATYFTLRRRSRRAIFCLMVFSILYFGFWREGCICPIGSIQNITLSLFDDGYTVSFAVTLFFLLPLIFTLLFGRTFCGSVCPLGAIQDVVLIKPIQLPVWLEHALGLLGYLYLGLAVLFAATGSAFIICQYDPFVSFYRLSGGLNILILGGCFLLISLFIGRPYCRFLCPYGVILRNLSRLSKWRVRITPDECIQCHLCEEACPFGAITPPYQAPPPNRYRRGRWTLLVLLVLLPGLMVLFGWLGGRLGPSFSRMHYRVRLADRIFLEENGRVEGTVDESDAFRTTGQPIEELYKQARTIQRTFIRGGRLLGLFMAVVIVAKLFLLTIRRTQTDYEADRGRCLACGRCFAYCPRERLRLQGKPKVFNHEPTGKTK